MPPLFNTLLLCEDHAYFRQSLAGFLLEKGAAGQIIQAADGKQALETAAGRCPDLVIMDVQMPILDGIAAAVRIKRLCRAVPVLLYSMYPAAFYGAQLKIADGFVQKDRIFEDLIPSIAALARSGSSASGSIPPP